jgi:hypothetical protein
MPRIEIVSGFVFFRLEPGNKLVRISLTIEFYLCPRVQFIGRRIESITGIAIRGILII